MNRAVKPEIELDTAAASRTRGIVLLALLTVYVVWGSTYLAIKVALEGYPPFGMAAVRFALAWMTISWQPYAPRVSVAPALP